jgi:hypothetical protein
VVYIAEQMRQQVVERANGRCEYCQTQQAIVVAMEIDHIVPQAAGGVTALDNLCLSCVICNGSKLDFQTGIDPSSGEEAPLFNPRVEVWNEHFRWSENGLEVIGLTAVGRATITRLRMNREVMINARRRWIEAGWHPPRSTP